MRGFRPPFQDSGGLPIPIIGHTLLLNGLDLLLFWVYFVLRFLLKTLGMLSFTEERFCPQPYLPYCRLSLSSG